jgi:hypothetical protein
VANSVAQAIEIGWDIYGAEDEKIGTVEELGHGYVCVRTGWRSQDLYIPLAEVTNVDFTMRRCWLSARKDEIDKLGWWKAPVVVDSARAAASGVTFRDAWPTGTIPEEMRRDGAHGPGDH